MNFIYFNSIYKSDIENFHEILNKFHQLKLDSNELICLKTLILFQTKFPSQFNHFPTISYLHNQSQILLNTYIQKQYPSDENRFLKFLTLLSTFHFHFFINNRRNFLSKNYRRSNFHETTC